MNIKDLAPELQELCHIRQKEQGNTGTFTGRLDDGPNSENFLWEATPEGMDFWSNINEGKNMTDHPKYPKTQTYQIF